MLGFLSFAPPSIAAGTDVPAGPPNPAYAVWTIEASRDSYFRAPAAVGHAVYFGGQDGQFYAVAPTGDVRWGYRTGFGVHTAPAVDRHGVIYFGVFNVGLCALHPNGLLKWISPHAVSQGCAPAIGPDGTVYYLSSWDPEDPTRGPCLYAVASDGAERWRLPLLGNVEYAKPAVARDGTIYIRASTGIQGGSRLLAVEPQGQVRWEVADAGATDPVVGPDGTIYVAGTRQEFLAVRPDGTRRWTATLDTRVTSPAVVDHEGRVCFGTDDGWVHALSPQGELAWIFETHGPVRLMDALPPHPPRTSSRNRHPPIRWSPVRLRNGGVLITSERTLYVIDREGRPAWSRYLPGVAAAAATVDTSGHIFLPLWGVPGLRGGFHAFRGHAAIAREGWPCLGGGLRCTGLAGEPYEAFPAPPTLTTDTLERIARELRQSMSLTELHTWGMGIIASHRRPESEAAASEVVPLVHIPETSKPPEFLRRAFAPYRPWRPYLQRGPSRVLILSTPPSGGHGYALTIGPATFDQTGELCLKLLPGVFLSNHPQNPD
jgi:outer membrane protein assembly factor BamB